MTGVIDNLNYEFNNNILIFNNNLGNLTNSQKIVALSWVNILKTFSDSIEEARIRNVFMLYLVDCAVTGSLKPPFTQPPPPEIEDIFHFLSNWKKKPKEQKTEPIEQKTEPIEQKTKDSEQQTTKTKRPDIFEKSLDKGEFLASQPVPRHGNFCYFTISYKNLNK